MAIERRACKFCGAQILLGVQSAASGAPLVLSEVRTIYRIDRDVAVRQGIPEEVEAGQWAVSHWETCSRVKQAKAAQERERARAAAGGEGRAKRSGGAQPRPRPAAGAAGPGDGTAGGR